MTREEIGAEPWFGGQRERVLALLEQKERLLTKLHDAECEAQIANERLSAECVSMANRQIKACADYLVEALSEKAYFEAQISEIRDIAKRTPRVSLNQEP